MTGIVTDSDGSVSEVAINWGDGSIDTINSGFNSINCFHTYAEAGNYTINITATDNDGESSTDEIGNRVQYLVIPGEMATVPAGTTSADNGSITLDYDIEIGKYEVTFDEYISFCNDYEKSIPADEGWGQGTRPVINISWYDAVEYCNWLSGQEGLNPAYTYTQDGWVLKDNPYNLEGYRLPTENEWQYAARGGSGEKATLYAGSDQLDVVGWYDENSGSKTHPVGEKQANELGIYDMSGNVWEWTNSFSTNYPKILGGCWSGNSSKCEVSKNSYSSSPSSGFDALGFRLTKTKHPNQPPVINITESIDDLVVTLSGEVSDNEGTVNELLIDWGDGENIEVNSGYDNINESHTYVDGGNYIITIETTDNNGKSCDQVFNVSVAPDQPPVLENIIDKTIKEGYQLQFTINANDGDGDNISYKMESNDLLDAGGATLDSSTGEFSWTPSYSDAGSYEVTFIASADGKSDSISITIQVEDAPYWETVINERIGRFEFVHGLSYYRYNGTSYIAYQNGITFDVKKYSNGEWERVGPGPLSGRYYDIQIDLDLDNDGTPYVIYQSWDDDKAAEVRELRYYEWEDSWNWSYKYSTYTEANNPSIYVEDEVIYRAYSDVENGGKLTVKQYGSQILGTAGFSENEVGVSTISVYNDSPYVAYQSGNDIIVEVYNGNNWETIINETFSDGNAYYVSIDLYNGIPYVAYCDKYGQNSIVKKYDGNGWKLIGKENFTEKNTYYISIFVDNGVPYVAFCEYKRCPNVRVMKFVDI